MWSIASCKVKQVAVTVQATVVMEIAPEATLQQLREFLALLHLKFGGSFDSADLTLFCRTLLQSPFDDAEITMVSLCLSKSTRGAVSPVNKYPDLVAGTTE